DGDAGVGEQVVARADLTVKVGAGVAGPVVQEVQVRVVGRRDPAVRAAARPGLAVVGPGLRARLPGLGDHVAAPHALPRLQLDRVGVTAHAELAAGAADDHHVLDDQRGDRRALAGAHVAERLVPDLLPALRVDRDDVRVEGGHEDLALGDRDAAVDV